MERISPLFPLPLVVFPNSFYPLHIFEPRYIKMISHCMKHKIPFVIIPVFSDTAASIGTLVKITQIAPPRADGSFDIIINGDARVQVMREWKHTDGYDEGLVVLYPEERDYTNLEMIHELEAKFREVLKNVQVELEDIYWQNLFLAKYKSFKIAEKCGLSLDQQIQLLSMQDEGDRIRFLLAHFKRMSTYLSKHSLAQSLIMNDGYLNPDATRETGSNL
jgi:Lon protease-like protein